MHTTRISVMSALAPAGLEHGIALVPDLPLMMNNRTDSGRYSPVRIEMRL